MKAKSWISLFFATLDDFMLKVLIVASIFSITFDMILAHAEERAHGKNLFPATRALFFGELNYNFYSLD